MSKIYEALQRAEQMRGAIAPEPLGDTIAAPSSVVTEPTGYEVSFLDFPSRSWTPDLELLPTLAESGRLLEQFRTLRSRMYEAHAEVPLKTMVVSSGSPREGKTFVAVNLAISLARSSTHRVLLIDGDMRHSSGHRLLGAFNGPGLSDYLSGNSDLKSIISRGPQTLPQRNNSSVSLANLAFIPGGSATVNSSELITNGKFEELISVVKSTFDWILIDSPPVSAVSDAVDIARFADGVLLVMRQGRSSSRAVQHANSVFSKTRLLGFVFNDVTDPPKRDYHSIYGPGQSRHSSGGKTAQRLE